MERIGKSLACAALAAALGAGCGGGGGSNNTGTGGSGGTTGMVTPTTGDYQPLVVGTTWTFHVDDKGVQYDKTVNVETLEDLGGPKAGTMGYRSRTTMPAESQLTWYQDTGNMVVRHHEQDFDSSGAMKSDEWYDPYRLRIDETPDHLMTGAAWQWTYNDIRTTRTKPMSSTPITESWTVDAVDEPVTVPAGTFSALKLTHVDPTDASTKTYWFVRGVGKVREETSGGHVEEMSSYNIPKQ